MTNASFSFNGVRKDFIFCEENGREQSVFAPLTRNLLTIPGRPGAFLESTETQIRVIRQRVFYHGLNGQDLRKLEEDLAAWLVTEEAVPLIFDDEKDRVYYAVVDGSFNIEETLKIGEGIITFICPDPYKYKYDPEKKENIDNFTAIDNVTAINVEGSVETKPIITAVLKEDVTFVAVSNGEQMNMVGRTVEAGEEVFEPETRRFWDQMATTVGWADTNSIEDGIKAGILKSDGYSFYTNDYGTGTKWHGPALKKSIEVPVQDFRVDALVKQIGSNGQVGSLEIAGLDAGNGRVFTMLLTKRSKDSSAVWARMRAGSSVNGHDIMNERGAYDWVWQHFEGILSLQRVGNQWEAYVAKDDQYGRHSSSRKLWTDSTSISTAPVTQIQVQFWQYGTIPTTNQRIDDLKVFQINNAADKVPILGRAGDIVKFNHEEDIITLNGVDITKHKAFIGSYFSLKPGVNPLVIEPFASIQEANARWKSKCR